MHSCPMPARNTRDCGASPVGVYPADLVARPSPAMRSYHRDHQRGGQYAPSSRRRRFRRSLPPTLNEWVSRSDLALGRAEPDTGQDRVSGYPLIIGDGDRDSARG
jgi:hypothetical protein